MSKISVVMVRIIPFLIGIVFIVLGITFFLRFKPEAYDAKATGRIARIEQHYESIAGENEIINTVYVDFTAGDKKYENVELKEYNPFMKVGDDIEIFYMTSDPTKIIGAGKDNVPYFGLGFALIGLAVIVIELIKIKRVRSGQTHGDGPNIAERYETEHTDDVPRA